MSAPWRLPVAGAASTRRASWALIRDDGRAMVVVLTLNCLAALAGVVPPWLLGEIVDVVGHGGTESTVDVLAIAILTAALAQLVLARYARYTGHRFGERALARMRERLVSDALALPPSVVERAGTGDLMQRSTGDVGIVGATIRDAAPEIFISVVEAGFVLVAVFLLDPRLGLCALLCLPLIVLGARWYLRRARAAYLDQGAADSEVSELIAETVQGARTIEAFGLGARRLAIGERTLTHARGTRMRTLALRSVLFPVCDIAYVLPVAAVMLVGGFGYLDGAFTLGAVSAAALYVWQLVDPLDRILMRIEELQASGASFARVTGVGEATGEPGTARTGGTAGGDRLAVTDVRYAYPAGPDVLRGIDLTVRPGERLAVVGTSGAGKTTLGRLLAGTDVPRTGSVTVGGVAVAALAPEELRERVALVTQDQHVFLGSLRDNLVIAAPAASDAELSGALAAVDAHWAGELADGLDTDLGPDGERLDAAQAQQLALARVVLADPHTVILDEATSLLDPATARHAERSLAAVLAGRTVIAIAHRLHTAHDADRIAVVDAGRIVELGSHDELVATGGAYAALWQSWQGG